MKPSGRRLTIDCLPLTIGWDREISRRERLLDSQWRLKKKTSRSGMLPDVFRRGEKTLLFKFHCCYRQCCGGTLAENIYACLRGCLKSPFVRPEIAALFYESLAMIQKCTLCHCEEWSDVAISRFSTAPCGGEIAFMSVADLEN